MNSTGISGHKHNRQHPIWTLVTLPIFTVVSLIPGNALAFESRLAVSPTVPFTAPVQLAGRDPYLAQAINNLPNYSYTAAGSVVATPTPRTIVAQWPAPRTWTPVRTAFVPATVPAAPAPAPRASAAAAPAATPAGQAAVVLEGEASYYSRAGCLGCNPLRIMANGQPLDDNAYTMAIGADRKHLVGRTARVTSLATGKSINVRITDTGGFYAAKYGNRVADLTIATKQAIGMAGGVGQVRVEVF